MKRRCRIATPSDHGWATPIESGCRLLHITHIPTLSRSTTHAIMCVHIQGQIVCASDQVFVVSGKLSVPTYMSFNNQITGVHRINQTCPA